MMRALTARAAARASARVATRVDQLAEHAAAELPDLGRERLADGIAITGPGLVRRLAFDARVRGLAQRFRERSR